MAHLCHLGYLLADHRMICLGSNSCATFSWRGGHVSGNAVPQAFLKARRAFPTHAWMRCEACQHNRWTSTWAEQTSSLSSHLSGVQQRGFSWFPCCPSFICVLAPSALRCRHGFPVGSGDMPGSSLLFALSCDTVRASCSSMMDG